MGSIPPGTINLSVIQLGLQQKISTALRLALAAALVEFFYSAIAIKFQLFITSNPSIESNFQLISALVLLILGIANLISGLRSHPNKKDSEPKGIAATGFRKGLLLGLGNPLNIPFWIVVTAYLQSNDWVNFDQTSIWSYVVGISLGSIAILMILAFAAKKTSKFIQPDNKLIKIIPGIVLVVLGLYSLVQLYIL
jgi:threonine/homoserine/homoserine lactone efflux protein